MNAGKTLKEIGGELKLNYVEIDTDKDSKTAEGKEALAHPDAAVIIQTAFAMSPVQSLRASICLASKRLCLAQPADRDALAAKRVRCCQGGGQGPLSGTECRDALGKLATSLVGRLSKGEDLVAVAADAGGGGRNHAPDHAHDVTARIAAQCGGAGLRAAAGTSRLGHNK